MIPDDQDADIGSDFDDDDDDQDTEPVGLSPDELPRLCMKLV